MAEIKVSSEYTFESVVRGYHIYQEILTAPDGEACRCRWEISNLRNPFAVAVVKKKYKTIVGHIPKKLSTLSSFFLRSGSIECQLMGSKNLSRDLPH